jgi:hypothetical protein
MLLSVCRCHRSPENGLNILKIAAIGLQTSTLASASFAAPAVPLGVTLGAPLGAALGSAMSGVDFLLGHGTLLGATVASLLLGIVIARRKLRR